MQADDTNHTSDADGYYGENDANMEELDLSFLDKDEDDDPKKK